MDAETVVVEAIVASVVSAVSAAVAVVEEEAVVIATTSRGQTATQTLTLTTKAPSRRCREKDPTTILVENIGRIYLNQSFICLTVSVCVACTSLLMFIMCVVLYVHPRRMFSRFPCLMQFLLETII